MTSAPNFQIDGTWEGTLRFANEQGLRNQDWPPEIWRLIIKAGAAQVFNMSRNGKEVKPGKFSLVRCRTNTLIYAIDSGADNDGIWVETECFVLTETGLNTLGATLTGVVNNENLPRENEVSSFFYVGIGEFHRV